MKNMIIIFMIFPFSVNGMEVGGNNDSQEALLLDACANTKSVISKAARQDPNRYCSLFRFNGIFFEQLYEQIKESELKKQLNQLDYDDIKMQNFVLEDNFELVFDSRLKLFKKINAIILGTTDDNLAIRLSVANLRKQIIKR